MVLFDVLYETTFLPCRRRVVFLFPLIGTILSHFATTFWFSSRFRRRRRRKRRRRRRRIRRRLCGDERRRIGVVVFENASFGTSARFERRLTRRRIRLFVFRFRVICRRRLCRLRRLSCVFRFVIRISLRGRRLVLRTSALFSSLPPAFLSLLLSRRHFFSSLRRRAVQTERRRPSAFDLRAIAEPFYVAAFLIFLTAPASASAAERMVRPQTAASHPSAKTLSLHRFHFQFLRPATPIRK